MAFPVFPHPPPVRFQALRRAGRTACCLFVAGILCACGQGGSGAGVPPNPAAMAVPVMVLQIAPRQVPIVLEAVGQVQGSKEVEVRARVNGILLKRLFSEGSLVQAQAPLFQIDPAPYEIALSQARAQLAQERARLEQTRREAVRLKQLAEEHAISQKEFDDATSALKLSEATSQGAEAGVRQAELNLSYTLVTAPVSGVTGRMLRSEGSLITAGQESSLLAAINQIQPIWVRFSLSESDSARIPGGKLKRSTSAEVRLTLPDGTPYPDKGRVNFAATQIDPRLATQELRAEFDNPRLQLLPGQFVRVQIIAGERENAFLVPQTAVIQTERGHFVFVVDPESKAAIRPVQTGEWVGSDWIILSGLNAGDRVILDNLLKLRPGAPVNAQSPAAPGAAGAKAAAAK
jgi:membrane fusion protein (multidrug efflux system)